MEQRVKYILHLIVTAENDHRNKQVRRIHTSRQCKPRSEPHRTRSLGRHSPRNDGLDLIRQIWATSGPQQGQISQKMHCINQNWIQPTTIHCSGVHPGRTWASSGFIQLALDAISEVTEVSNVKNDIWLVNHHIYKSLSPSPSLSVSLCYQHPHTPTIKAPTGHVCGCQLPSTGWS